MIFFYKNYNEYSRLATFFSMIGGLFYATAIICVIAGFSAEDLGIGGGIAMGAVMAVLGFCNNALANSIAKKHGAPINNNASNNSSSNTPKENKNVNANTTDSTSNNTPAKQPVIKEQVQNEQTVTESEPVLVGGVQESIDSLAALKEKENTIESEDKSQNEWKCTYCGTINNRKVLS